MAAAVSAHLSRLALSSAAGTASGSPPRDPEQLGREEELLQDARRRVEAVATASPSAERPAGGPAGACFFTGPRPRRHECE